MAGLPVLAREDPPHLRYAAVDKVRQWMLDRKEEYLKSFGSAEVCAERLIASANAECGTEVPEADLSVLAREVMAKELAEEATS